MSATLMSYLPAVAGTVIRGIESVAANYLLFDKQAAVARAQEAVVNSFANLATSGVTQRSLINATTVLGGVLALGAGAGLVGAGLCTATAFAASTYIGSYMGWIEARIPSLPTAPPVPPTAPPAPTKVPDHILLEMPVNIIMDQLPKMIYHLREVEAGDVGFEDATKPTVFDPVTSEPNTPNTCFLYTSDAADE